MDLFTSIFTYTIGYITINCLLFVPIDNRTKFKKEINNRIFFILIVFGVFILLYDKPFKIYRKETHYRNRLIHINYVRNEVKSMWQDNLKVSDIDDEELQIIRYFKLKKLTNGKKSISKFFKRK